MSVRMALAKLSAAAAGGALLGGGAVHVAEPQAAVTTYKSAKAEPVYVKQKPTKRVAVAPKKKVKRIRRVGPCLHFRR